MYATQTAQDTARDAVQIFGGRGITRTGMGRFIEHVSDRHTLCSLVQVTDAAHKVSPYHHF